MRIVQHLQDWVRSICAIWQHGQAFHELLDEIRGSFKEVLVDEYFPFEIISALPQIEPRPNSP
jgi:hypothetical protein